MKRLIISSLLAVMALSMLFVTSCKPDEPAPEAQITAFRFTNPVDAFGIIDEAAKTITVNVPFGTDLANVIGTITATTGATVSPDITSGVDFSSLSVKFTVTLEDISATYTVNVEVGPNPLRVALVGDAADMNNLDAEIKDAYQWALDTYQEKAGYFNLADLTATDIETATVLWFHYTTFPRPMDSNADDLFEGFEVLPQSAIDAAPVIKAWYQAGGNLLLTGLTGSYVATLGRILPEEGPTNFDIGGDEFIENPDNWGISFLEGYFEAGQYPSDNGDHYLFTDLATTDVTFEGVTYPAVFLSTGGQKKNRAHIWDWNRFYPNLMGGCDDPNAKKAQYETNTNSVVRASFEWDPAACGVELGAIVEFLPGGEYSGTAIVIGLGAYEWNMLDGRALPSNVPGITANAIDNFVN